MRHINIIPILFFLVSQITSASTAQNLESASDLAAKIALLRTDTGTFCSSFFVKYAAHQKCSSTRGEFHTLLSADHCFRGRFLKKSTTDNTNEAATIAQLYKNIKIEKSCLSQTLKTADNSEVGDIMTSSSDNDDSEFLRTTPTKSPYVMNPETFRPLLTIRMKPLAKVETFELKLSTEKTKPFQTPSLRQSSKEKKRASSPSTSTLNRSTQSSTPNFSFAEISGSSVTPTAIDQFRSATPLVKVSNPNSNLCTDLAQFPIKNETQRQIQMPEFEIAAKLPALNDPVTVLGFQFGCNPVALKCEYAGATNTILGVQPIIRCPSLNSKSYKGLSGGPVLNKDGFVVGMISQSGEKDSAGTKGLFAFSPLLQSNISCNGQIAPSTGIISFDGYFDKGNLKSDPITARYEEKNGCYIADSLALATPMSSSLTETSQASQTKTEPTSAKSKGATDTKSIPQIEASGSTSFSSKQE